MASKKTVPARGSRISSGIAAVVVHGWRRGTWPAAVGFSATEPTLNPLLHPPGFGNHHGDRDASVRPSTMCYWFIIRSKWFPLLTFAVPALRTVVAVYSWTDRHPQYRFPRVGSPGERDVHARVRLGLHGYAVICMPRRYQRHHYLQRHSWGELASRHASVSYTTSNRCMCHHTTNIVFLHEKSSQARTQLRPGPNKAWVGSLFRSLLFSAFCCESPAFLPSVSFDIRM